MTNGNTRSWIAAGLVSLTSFLALALTERQYGYAIDEASYLWVAREERQWFADLPERGLNSFTAPAIAERWHFLESPGEKHDSHSNFNLPLSMHLLNVGWLAGGWWLNELVACRLAPMALFSFLVGAVYLSLGRTFNCWAGFAASAALLFSPRIFGHAHLAATETILCVFWTLTILSLLRLRRDDRTNGDSPPVQDRQTHRRWPGSLITATLLSLTMAVKLSGWFLAPAVAIWLVAVRPRGWLATLALCIALPIPMIVVLTPSIWHHPIEGLTGYIRQVLDNPWTIPTYFLGNGYADRLPPWSGLMMIGITTPISVLLLAAVALLLGARDRRIWAIALPTVSILGASVAGLLPTHDGERHLLPAAYGLSLLAGAGVGLLAHRWLSSESRHQSIWYRLAFVISGILVFAEPAADTCTYRGHGLCYYNRIVGGLPGASRLGFEPSYWFETVTDQDWHAMLDDLPPNATVFLRPDHPGSDDLKRWGIWRNDIQKAGPEAGTYLLYDKRAAYLVPGSRPGEMVETDLGILAENGPMDKESRFQGVRLFGRCRRPY